MPRKTEKLADDAAETQLQSFLYPTIGDGVTIRAKDQHEADHIASELKASQANS